MDNNELVMLQSLPLNIKVEKSKQRIREAIKEFGVNGIYVPGNGGLGMGKVLDLMGVNYKPIS